MNGSIEVKNERIHKMFRKGDGLSTDLSTAIPQRKLIIVVIVHYGNKKNTDNLVTVLLHNSRIPERIVVVNNDNEKYSYSHKAVLCVESPQNNGYVAGLRLGAEKSKKFGYYPQDIIIALNNDVAIDSMFIEKIQNWWSVKGSANTLAGPTHASLSLITGRATIQGKGITGFSIQYVHGACMVMERSFFEEISQLEQLHMYWEDVAMSMNTRMLGGNIRTISKLALEHDDALSEVSAEKLYYLVRNGAYVLERLPFPWGVYWKFLNKIRLKYHQFRNHDGIISALLDARNIV